MKYKVARLTKEQRQENIQKKIKEFKEGAGDAMEEDAEEDDDE